MKNVFTLSKVVSHGLVLFTLRVWYIHFFGLINGLLANNRYSAFYMLLELFPEYHDWFNVLPMLLPVSSFRMVRKGLVWSLEEK